MKEQEYFTLEEINKEMYDHIDKKVWEYKLFLKEKEIKKENLVTY